MIKTSHIELSTGGHTDIIDITDSVRKEVESSSVKEGVVNLFVVGSTAGLTTIEYEPGLVEHDLKEFFEKIAPYNADYKHHGTWHDDNGASHVRASLLKPDLSVPVVDGSLVLGTWQQIVLVDFDTRPRERKIVMQITS